MIASFVAPYSSNPALVLCYQIVEPVLAPFAKLFRPPVVLIFPCYLQA